MILGLTVPQWFLCFLCGALILLALIYAFPDEAQS